jgi:hypothetical protein
MSALAEMLSLDLAPAIAVSGLLANSTTTALVRLSMAMDKWNDLTPALEKLTDEIDKLYLERNLIVHGHGTYSSSGTTGAR